MGDRSEWLNIYNRVSRTKACETRAVPENRRVARPRSPLRTGTREVRRDNESVQPIIAAGS
jgi:hypothetical protein